MEPPKSSSPKRRKISQKPYTPIYPDLSEESHEAVDQSEQQGHSYRLQKIALLKRQLEGEREQRASLYKNIIEVLMS